jgi:hypothetical protein
MVSVLLALAPFLLSLPCFPHIYKPLKPRE